MNIELVPVEQIDDTNRLRPVDEAYVALIAASVAAKGVESPIKVRPNRKKGGKAFLLVYGGHRVAAARTVGLAEIPAIVETMNDDEARLAEIDENVYRHDLSDLDRAVFLAEKKAIHERLFPLTAHGAQNRNDEGRFRVAIFGDTGERFTSEVQERLGYSERTIQRIIRRAAIPADVRARIAGTRLARSGTELDALLKLDRDLQHATLNIVLGSDPDAPKSISLAASLIAGKRGAAAKDEVEEQLKVLMRAWRGAGARARRRFIDGLVSENDPMIVEAINVASAPSAAAA